MSVIGENKWLLWCAGAQADSGWLWWRLVMVVERGGARARVVAHTLCQVVCRLANGATRADGESKVTINCN